MAGFTDAQKACIESTADRLVISAGAGTGKTFTITQKIAHMMETGFLSSIEEVLAITFTAKAAGEIKARVRSTLRSKGMLGQALLVDGAWIGTIHGMCSRILKEHALAIGISPAFSVLDDIDASNLLGEALEETLAGESGRASGDYDILFADHPKPGEVAGIVTSLIGQAKKSPRGFDSIVTPPAPRSPQEIITRFLIVLREALSIYDGCAWVSRSFEDVLAWTVGAIDEIEPLCAEMRHGESRDGFLAEAAGALESIASPKKIRGSKFPDAVEQSARVVLEFNRACAEIEGIRSCAALGQALGLAARAAEAYESKKRARGLVDNDDLLVMAYKALDTVPGIAKRYRERFRLILVDEFQDTSELQIGIINLITGPHAQLCTVGDAQQSIYRFRGADVNVYRRFIADLGVEPVELDENFRSHEDILRFSNSIFGLPGVFDDMYLPLKRGRKPEPGPYRGLPRVEVVSVQYGYRQARTDDMRRYEAAQIAERFARFREAGARPGDMVVLMGRMTAFQAYADALAARGFEVVVAGGSGFWASEECEMVDSLLRVLANPRDDEALYRFLESGVVPIGDGDLVALISAGGGRRRRISEGFRLVGEEDSPQLRKARGLVDDAAANIARRGIAGAAERLFAEAGLPDRLGDDGASGSSSWANILKALRFVRQFEEEKGLGIAGVSALFSQHCAEGSKEGPGMLAAESGNAVRIMTIHASKGLEFPIVALVEYSSTWAPPGFRAQTLGGKTYVLLDAGSNSGIIGEGVHKGAGEFSKDLSASDEGYDWGARLDSAGSYGEFSAALAGYGAAEDLAEAKRKFYVGITRASEALVVGASHYVSKNSPAQGGLLDDLRRAAFGGGAYPREDCEFDYGGTAPGKYSFIGIAKDAEGIVRWVGNEDYLLPEIPPSKYFRSIPPEGSGVVRPMDSPRGPGDGRFFSYSSIALHMDEAMPEPPQEGGGAGPDPLMGDEDSATELGLAFHAVAEHMALRGLLGGGNASGDASPAGTGAVVPPSQERVDAVAAFHALSDAQRARLSRAVGIWAGSDVARRAAGYGRVRPEVPFCLEFASPGGGGGPHLINGEIDLLCSDPGRPGAFIVDYKTGGRDGETAEYLSAKHRLQSLCYAYAALTAEFESVDIAFVRVEREGGDGQPETVAYSYARDDLPSITAEIAAALEASLE